MNIQLQTALENNSKEWEKGSMKRIYVQDTVKFVRTVNEGKQILDHELVATRKSKIWVDMKDESLHSDVGIVRMLMSQNGIKCVK